MTSHSRSSGDDDPWLAWAKRVRAIAQTGRAYAADGYDLERYRELTDIAEAMLAALMHTPPARVRNVFLPERGYPTPKVDVRAGVFRGDMVLLVRETSDGRWSLPGGWADEHESPSRSIEREVAEEAGCPVRVVKLTALKDRSLHPYHPPRLEHVYKLFFLCELAGPAGGAEVNAAPGPAANLETTAARFFPVDALPALSRGRTLEADVEALFAHHRDRSLPVTFD